MKNREHLNQIILSEDELIYQLNNLSFNRNLIKCIALGKENRDYGKYLLLTSIKFAFISSCFYLNSENKAVKPNGAYYEKLFDNALESEDEAKDYLADLKCDKDKENVVLLLQKYKAVKYCCLKMLSSEKEVYFADEFKDIIESVIKNEISVPIEFNGDFPILKNGYGFNNEYGNWQN